MPDPSCANCRFSTIEGRSTRTSIVICRRYPPHPVAVVGERFEPDHTLQGYWPRVGSDDECGEHQFAE